MQNPWNSLEIVKLIVSASTPIIVVLIGSIINRSIKRLDKKQWTNQRIIEKRLLIYDKVVPILNDVFCFHCYIGNWKNISAKDIIDYKRILDKEMNVYSPLFDKEVIKKYNYFIDHYYQTNTGWGNDAKIKSLHVRRQDYSKVWNNSDIGLFSKEYISSASESEDSEDQYISEKKGLSRISRLFKSKSRDNAIDCKSWHKWSKHQLFSQIIFA
jgi:hypothetical protein